MLPVLPSLPRGAGCFSEAQVCRVSHRTSEQSLEDLKITVLPSPSHSFPVGPALFRHHSQLPLDAISGGKRASKCWKSTLLKPPDLCGGERRGLGWRRTLWGTCSPLVGSDSLVKQCPCFLLDKDIPSNMPALYFYLSEMYCLWHVFLLPLYSIGIWT